MGYTIKFDTLKAKAKHQLNARLNRGSDWPNEERFLALLSAATATPRRKPAEVLDEWQDAAHAIIDAWDIRKAVELIRLFPAIVPARLTKGPTIQVPHIDYSDAGEWTIVWN